MPGIELDSLTVVVPETAARCVVRAAEEVVAYSTACANVSAALSPKAPATGTILCAGPDAARRVLGADVLAKVGLEPSLGPEGYVLALRHVGRRSVIVAAGNSDIGTHHALLHALRCIDVRPQPVAFSLDADVRTAPAFGLRGMYAHQHWSYRYPYALRTWSVPEWQQYVDFLAHGRMNLFQIWSMAALCPAPFSPADRAFLQRYPPIIGHAQTAHGMQVWIGECANNTAKCGPLPPVPDRRYFDVEVLKNPADPAQLDELLAHRRAFYELCDNADGYWIIDSDPGGWEGSPTSDFVRILAANRRLINESTRKSLDARLIYWMWVGWGTGSRDENCARAAERLLQEIDPPIWLTHSWEGHFATTRGSEHRQRTVYFPYGAIEPEPSLPFTTVIPPALSGAIGTAQAQAPFAGILGNAQTPLVQLLNIWYFANCAWDPGYARRSKADVVGELAHLLFPQAAQTLAEGWLALDGTEAASARVVARELDLRVAQKRLGIPGPLGRLVFPDPDRIAEDLLCLLGIHAAALEFCEAADNEPSDESVFSRLKEYVSRSIDWRHRTGFKRFGYYGYDFEPVHAAAHRRWRDGLPGWVIEQLRNLIRDRSHEETGDLQLFLAPLGDRRDGKGFTV